MNIRKLLIHTSLLALILKLVLSKNLEADIEGGNWLSYLCDVIIIFTAFISVTEMQKEFVLFYVAFFILLITFPLSTSINGEDLFSAVKSLLRIFAPIFAFTHYASYFKNKKDELIKVSLILLSIVVLLTLYGFVSLPPAQNRVDGFGGGLWWPAYFSNIHTTTYVISSLFFITYSLYQLNITKLSRAKVAATFIVVFYAIGFGWGVRTSTLSILVLVIFLVFVQVAKRYGAVKPISFSLILSFFPVWYFYLFDFELYSKISSGRLTMYVEKYNQLSGNTFITWLIGNGAGSDLIYSDVWWWAKKGAHSDFITVLVEGGVVFLSIFTWIHFKLFNLLKHSQTKYIVVSVGVTGLLSNGFLTRPVGMYMLVLALTIGYYDSYNKNKREMK